ncbi:hypothetical protein LOD99_2488 [Oopsacas minuta]|uniref:tRNA-splicing endonuclease subunit Sen54 N-terminal domain-containing protein n=1 Tax=Oopsacas minuta TaxID=111878 RepID=A0AAV7K2C4_9METZ|nr:hypothetical protein LOD99_2488 [Oopsacas minuta]
MAGISKETSLTTCKDKFPISDVVESDIFPDLATNTFKSQKDVSVGKYDSSLGLIEITKSKGSAWRNIGGNVGSKLYLFPEEALFLFECNKLQIYGESELLSSEDIWSALCPSKQAFNKYIAYAQLKRMGYIVIRHGAYKSTHQNIYTEYIINNKGNVQVGLDAPAKRSKLDYDEQAESKNSDFPTPSFDLYQAGEYYMKTALLKPDNSIAVVASSEPFPSKDMMDKLSLHPNLLLALVTECNANIFSFQGGLESI